MVPVKGLGLEAEGQDERKDDERYTLLDDLELNQIEGTAVDIGPYAVGGNHDAILKESQAPGCQDDQYQRPVRTYFHLLKLEVAVPRECHQNI